MVMVGLTVLLFAGLAICVAGFKIAAYAAEARRDIHIFSGCAVAVIGAGLASWAVTQALN